MTVLRAGGGVQVPCHHRACGGWLLMGGTLTKSSGRALVSSTCVCRLVGPFGGVLVGGCGGTVLGDGRGLSSTLLGPQVTGHRWWGAWYGPVLRPRTASSLFRGCRGRRVGWGRGRWLFENCTVDASIFVKIKTRSRAWFLVSAVLLLLKFLRAQGGCLGTRSRRRTL